jgi:hypothetical protein
VTLFPGQVTSGLAGGLPGSWALRRVNERVLRIAIVCIGAGLTIGLFLKPI